MHAYTKAFYERVSLGVRRAFRLDNLSRWVCDNTRLGGEPFSFRDHEFQQAIVDDASNEVVVKKCSQVGLSEVQVRKVLGFLQVMSSVRAIWILPTRTFAQKFAKDRIDGVIRESPTLAAALNKGADSTEMKQFGGSTLYIQGSIGSTDAISVPARLLSIDELDFCDQGAVSKYASRLRHNLDGGIRYKFSTPTVSQYGITAEFARSDQKFYTVRCPGCAREVVPRFVRDVRIPGFDGDFAREFVREDLRNPRFRVDQAWLACPRCQAPLDRALADPDRRRWVAAYPEVPVSGYQVSPFDLIRYNPTPAVLRQLGEYAQVKDWYNFVLGLEYDSEDTGVVLEKVKTNTIIRPVPPEQGAYGTVMGIDVGKVSWMFVGKAIGNGYTDIIWVQQLRQDAEGGLKAQIQRMMGCYNPHRLVIDGLPAFTLVDDLIKEDTEQRVYACYYDTQRRVKRVAVYRVDEAERKVVAHRSKSLDVVRTRVNQGRVRFPQMEDEMAVVREHLSGLKRIERKDENGDIDVIWERTGVGDHYFHALNYMNMAEAMTEQDGLVVLPPGLINISGVELKKFGGSV